jgi:hypothetical protein
MAERRAWKKAEISSRETTLSCNKEPVVCLTTYGGRNRRRSEVQIITKQLQLMDTPSRPRTAKEYLQSINLDTSTPSRLRSGLFFMPSNNVLNEHDFFMLLPIVKEAEDGWIDEDSEEDVFLDCDPSPMSVMLKDHYKIEDDKAINELVDDSDEQADEEVFRSLFSEDTSEEVTRSLFSKDPSENTE